jgi:predicted metal-dependent hydrolase
MIDWRRRELLEPRIELAGRTLPIALRRNARARRLTLRMAPDGSEVRVTLPRWCRSAEALAFVHARAGWLGEQLAKVPERRPPAPGGTVLYRGEPLTLDWRPHAPRTPRLSDGRLTLGGPAEGLAGRVQRWLEREALRLTAAPLGELLDRRDGADQLAAGAGARRGAPLGRRARGRALRSLRSLAAIPHAARRSVRG